jgi:sigma-B regulation protein RsbU (phosphoserine phosphatase)
VRFLDLSTDPALPHFMAMLRELTKAQSARAAVTAFVSRFVKVRPIEYLIGVVPVGDEPGAFRMVFGFPADNIDIREAFTTDRVYLDSLPISRGGFISEVIGDGMPKFAMDLSLRDDPVLGSMVPDMRNCMVVPVFDGEHIASWNLSFSRGLERDIDPRDVGQAQLITNLLGLASRQLTAVTTIKTLNGQLRDQLDQLARVQQSLLPSRTPDIPGLEIATSYLTSNESGGDYYDFFPLPGERWAILIADVSGHGAAAATVMAMLHAILHCYTPLNPGEEFDPAKVMEFANERLLSAGLEGNFVTAFFGVYDPASGELRYTNAGHNPPRVKDGLSGRISALEGAATLPLGILQDLDARSETVQLKPNDTIILYTDGITEAFGPAPSQEQFGVERLDAALVTCSGQPDCVVDSVHAALYEHRRAATRDDDQTIVAIRHHGLCRI